VSRTTQNTDSVRPSPGLAGLQIAGSGRVLELPAAHSALPATSNLSRHCRPEHCDGELVDVARRVLDIAACT
jgi:hypothetical protein